MLPRRLLAVITLAVALGAAFGSPASPRRVQEGSPAPSSDGITIEMLAAPPGTPVPGAGANMYLYRITLAPGAVSDAHAHVGAAIMLVESGSILYRVEAGQVYRQCDGRCDTVATPVAAPEGCVGGCELLPPSREVELAPGDWVVQYDTSTHAYRNDGSEPAVILVSALAPEIHIEGCVGGCE